MKNTLKKPSKKKTVQKKRKIRTSEAIAPKEDSVNSKTRSWHEKQAPGRQKKPTKIKTVVVATTPKK